MPFFNWSLPAAAPLNSPNPWSQSGTAPLSIPNSPSHIPGSFGSISEMPGFDAFHTPHMSYTALPTNNADINEKDQAGDDENSDMVSGIFSHFEPP
jgi:hypothetical protein